MPPIGAPIMGDPIIGVAGDIGAGDIGAGDIGGVAAACDPGDAVGAFPGHGKFCAPA
jgi:hypothetical protein